MQVPRIDPSLESPKFYKFRTNLRIITLTLCVVILIGVLVDGFINDDFGTASFILIGVIAWNFIYAYFNKPIPPKSPNEIQ